MQNPNQRLRFLCDNLTRIARNPPDLSGYSDQIEVYMKDITCKTPTRGWDFYVIIDNLTRIARNPPDLSGYFDQIEVYMKDITCKTPTRGWDLCGIDGTRTRNPRRDRPVF